MIVFLQPKNKELKEVIIMALQSLRESYLGLLLSTLIDVSPSHPKKALFEILVTLEGITMDVRPVQ